MENIDRSPERFIKTCSSAIAIIEEVVQNKSLYTNDERAFMHEFSDTHFGPLEEEIKYNILKIMRQYHAKINHRNMDDPKNNELINTLLDQLAIQKEALKRYAESLS